MIYLHETIDFINSILQQRLNAYPTAEIKGIATTMLKNSNNKIITYPSVINVFGKSDYIGYNNNVPFTIYHKLINSTFTRRPGQNYGDDNFIGINSLTDMQLICIGKRKELNIKPEQFAMIIIDGLPNALDAKEFKTLGIKDVKIISAGINYDQRNVFNQEIQGIPYFIGPELFIFSIRYRIDGTYMKGCLKLCEC